MARPATSVSARIAALEIALTRASALPFGTTLSFDPMMQIVGVSRPVLRDWCNSIAGFATSGCFEAGARGIEWTFHPVATVLFLLRHFEAERGTRAARAAKVREIVGGEALAEVGDEFSIDELGKMIRLSTDLQNARERAGQLTDATVAASAVTTLLAAIQQAVLRAAQEEDQTGQWPVEIRESFENATRRILLRAKQAGEACLSSLRGSAAQPR